MPLAHIYAKIPGVLAALDMYFENWYILFRHAARTSRTHTRPAAPWVAYRVPLREVGKPSGVMLGPLIRITSALTSNISTSPPHGSVGVGLSPVRKSSNNP